MLFGEFAFSMENLGNDAFRTKDICKVPLPQAMRFHQVAQYIERSGIRDWIIISLEILNQQQQQTHQLLFGCGEMLLAAESFQTGNIGPVLLFVTDDLRPDFRKQSCVAASDSAHFFQ